MHDITGAAGAGNAVLETCLSPCFLKLAIILMTTIVRIYYKDITTVLDPCSSPALMDGHNFIQLSLSLSHCGSVNYLDSYCLQPHKSRGSSVSPTISQALPASACLCTRVSLSPSIIRSLRSVLPASMQVRQAQSTAEVLLGSIPTPPQEDSGCLSCDGAQDLHWLPHSPWVCSEEAI